MNNDNIKIFYDFLNDDEYCLLYNGNFVDSVTAKIIHITKVSLIQRGELIRIQNRLAYLIAECFQNIIRHGGHKELDSGDARLPGFFMTKIKNNFYDLVTGNLIDNVNISPLKKQFDAVNALNDDELKDLYKKTLAEGKLSDKGGAGIGLIDMAKKSAQKLEYKFINDAAENSMFYQRLVMTSNGDVLKRNGVDNNIEFSVNLHKAMVENNVLVLQKSDFSRDSVLPMLNIVEENIVAANNSEILVKIIYQVLIEIIHNINQHDLKLREKKEAIFLVTKDGAKYNICSGYFIDNNKVKLLVNYIEMVEKMEHDRLEKSFLNKLKVFENSESANSIQQKVDIKSIIAERFQFSFSMVNEKATFFSVKAVV